MESLIALAAKCEIQCERDKIAFICISLLPLNNIIIIIAFHVTYYR